MTSGWVRVRNAIHNGVGMARRLVLALLPQLRVERVVLILRYCAQIFARLAQNDVRGRQSHARRAAADDHHSLGQVAGGSPLPIELPVDRLWRSYPTVL